MQELTITDLEAGQRLNKYMMKYLNQAPSSFIYKMLRKNFWQMRQLKSSVL